MTPMETARQTRDMLIGAEIALTESINNNLSEPKPHHKNLPLMTALLQMEVSHEACK